MANGRIKFRDNNEIRSSGTNGFYTLVNGVLTPIGAGGSGASVENVVYQTGNQEISGSKVFKNNTTFEQIVYFGYNNVIFDNLSAIAGGESNRTDSTYTFIGGGQNNYVTGEYSSVSAGISNKITGAACFIGGGDANKISGNYNCVAGGAENEILQVSGVLGGSYSGAMPTYCFVGAGKGCGISNSSYSVVVGGFGNGISSTGSPITSRSYNSIGGGWTNFIQGLSSNATIAGGKDNEIYDSRSCSIVGGEDNFIYSGNYSAILGGRDSILNSGSHYSVAIGRKSIINHSGAAVFADGQDRNHNSKGQNTLSLDYSGGVYLRLPAFSGPSNQTGNSGELKLSGDYLYVCTGDLSGWGRIQLLNF